MHDAMQEESTLDLIKPVADACVLDMRKVKHTK